MKRVRFYIPSEIIIQDRILNIRRKIQLTDNLSLKMIRRFQEMKNKDYKICSESYKKEIAIDKPLRSQGILPGDIINIIPIQV